MEYVVTIKIGRGLLLFLAGMAVAGVAGAAWLFVVLDPLSNLHLRVNLQQQPVRVRIAASFPVTADIDQMLRVPLKADIPVNVPFSKKLSVPLEKTFDAPVEINTTIPVYMTVPFKSLISIDTQVFLDTKVRTSVLGLPLTIPIRGYVPVRATIPVDETVTVKEDFKLALRTPVTVHIQDTFTIPITTHFTGTVPVDTELRIPFQETIQANVALAGTAADQIPDLYILDNAVDIDLGRFRLLWKKDR